MRKLFLSSALIAMATVSIPLSGCALSPLGPVLQTESELQQQPMRVTETYHAMHLDAENPSHADIETVARSYTQQANNATLYIAVGYDTSKQGYGPAHAEKHAGIIASALRKKGINNIKTSAVEIAGADHKAVLGFSRYEAKSSASCNGMEAPAYRGTETRITMDGYKLGCQMQNMFAKQIAHPSDLLGNGGLNGKNDAQRAANVIDNSYRSGEARDYLPGFVLSELGGGGE